MSNYLAVELQRYLAQAGVTAAGLEEASGLPAASLPNIWKGGRPKVDRLDKILDALPDPFLVKVLRAYILDAVPETKRDRVHVQVDPANPGNTIREDAKLPNTPKDRARAALEWFMAEIEHDPKLGSHLADMAELLQRKG